MFKSVFTKLFRAKNLSSSIGSTVSSNCSQERNSQCSSNINIAAISYSQSACENSNNSNNNNANNNSSSNSNYQQCSSPSLSVRSSESSEADGMNIITDESGNQIFVPPSCIRYSNSTLNDTIIRISDEDINLISKQVLESNNTPPKLQIVLYDGYYYAINNSSLQIYKKLEKFGIITHVQADILSLDTIPAAIRENLFIYDPNFDESFNELDATNDYEEEDCNADSAATTNTAKEPIDAGLVQETYEFGECDKCAIESDNNSLVDENGENNVDIFNSNKNTSASEFNDNDDKNFFSPNRFPLFNDLLKPTKTMKTTQVPELQNLLENKSTD